MGGLTVVVVVLFEVLANKQAEKLQEVHPLPNPALYWYTILVIALGIGFLLAVKAIQTYETKLLKDLQRRWSEDVQKSITLKEVGEVDGKWIDAIWENGTLSRCSIVRISSTKQDGFTVKGETYACSEADDNTPIIGPQLGRFDGKGHPCASRDRSVLFDYSGYERGVRHDGAIFYDFHRPVDETELDFLGYFVAHEMEGKTFKVYGKRLKKSEEDEWRSAMTDFLRSMMERNR